MEWFIGILVLVILGFLAGLFAKLLMPGQELRGPVATSILGICGALLGGWLASILNIGQITGLNWRSILIAVGGSFLLLLIYRALRMFSESSYQPTDTSRGTGSSPRLRAFSSGNESTSTINLAEVARGALSTEVVEKLGNRTGESVGGTRKALEAMIPTILALSTNQASTGGGANRIFDLARDATQVGVDRLLGEGNVEALTHASRSIVNTLFGDKLGGVLSWLARFAGINESSSSSLVSVASSLVMNLLGKTVQQKGLNAAGLSRLLASQSGWIARHLPAGIGEVPGMRGLADFGERAVETPRAAADTGTRPSTPQYQMAYGERPSLGSALLPLLLLAIPLLAFSWYMRGRAARPVAHPGEMAARTPNEPVARPPGAPHITRIEKVTKERQVVPTHELVPTTLKLVDVRLPNNITVKLPESSFLNRVYQYLTDKAATTDRTFTFEDLEFDASAIKSSPETETAINNLSALLKAFPKATLRIDGYTEKTDNSAEDQRKSLARAEALKSHLVRAGISADRITAEGHGGDKPVASNDTPEGKAKNRRLELSIHKTL